MMGLALAAAEARPLWELVPVPAEVQAACPLPDGWGTSFPAGLVSRVGNSVSFVDGKPAWNGIRIDAVTLRRYVEMVAQMTPRPVIIVLAMAFPATSCAESPT